MNIKFNLGSMVKDAVTGYGGRVTALAVYLTGEIQYLIENVDNTGRPIEQWVNEQRLNAIGMTNNIPENNQPTEPRGE